MISRYLSYSLKIIYQPLIDFMLISIFLMNAYGLYLYLFCKLQYYVECYLLICLPHLKINDYFYLIILLLIFFYLSFMSVKPVYHSYCYCCCMSVFCFEEIQIIVVICCNYRYWNSHYCVIVWFYIMVCIIPQNHHI